MAAQFICIPKKNRVSFPSLKSLRFHCSCLLSLVVNTRKGPALHGLNVCVPWNSYDEIPIPKNDGTRWWGFERCLSQEVGALMHGISA